MAKVTLAVRYRPKTFEDVVEQEAIKDILTEQIETNSFKHAYLFCGPAGCGKTTAARIFANEMNKGKGMTLYVGTCLTTGNKIQVESKARLSELGYSPSCVIRVCNGDRISHKNMTWEKVKSPDRLANN